MRRIGDWAGADLLDIGCGTGYHLPRFATSAVSVTGVEPHPGLVALARRRTRAAAGRDPRLCPMQVVQGTAQSLPLPPACVDIVHARWAYFFGPGCEPGLRQIQRVLRRGGTAFVIDNDVRTSTFGRWFQAAYPAVDPDAVERFWSSHGWQREPVMTRWEMASRADFESVVRIELDPATADRVLAETPGSSVDYAVNVWWRRA